MKTMQVVNKRKGFILLSVLLTSVVLLTAATAFAWFARTEVRAQAARERIYRFRSVAEIAVSVAAQRIAEDSNGWDGYTEPLYSPDKYLKIEIGEYSAEVQIRPLNDKIPINSILLPDNTTVRTEYAEAWDNIWETLGYPQLAQEVIDFIDADTQSPSGAEKETNINRQISDITELRSMPDMTEAILWGTEESYGLAHYVTALTSDTININVTSPEVIAMLDSSLTISHGNNVAAYRDVNPLLTIEDLNSVPGFPPELPAKLSSIISFESTHFLLAVKITDSAENTRNYRVVVERGGDGVVRWEE